MERESQKQVKSKKKGTRQNRQNKDKIKENKVVTE